MAITISNISISRTNAFNGKSISNITEHRLSFNLAGCGDTTVIIILINGTEKIRKGFFSPPSQVYYDIGSFEANVSNADFKAINVDIIVKDSNKNSAKASTAFSVYKYSPPDVTATVERNSSEQPILKFTSSFQGTVAGATNSLKQFFVRGNNNGTVFTTDLKGKASPQTINGTYDISKSYEFVIFIQDQVRPSSIVKRVTLPSVNLVMDIGADGNSIAFFGTASNSATKQSLKISDFASFAKDSISEQATSSDGKQSSLINISGNSVAIRVKNVVNNVMSDINSIVMSGANLSISANGKVDIYGNSLNLKNTINVTGEVSATNNVKTDANFLANNNNGLSVKDSSGTYRAIASVSSSNNTVIGYGLYANNQGQTRIYGGQSINFITKTPAAEWKPYYSKGDTVSDLIRTAGFVTNSGREVQFTIPLSKPVIGNPTVTVTNVDGFCVRQAGKYIYGSTASAYTKASKITADIAFGGCIVIVATMPNTTNAVNNDVCGVTADLKIAFS